ncbi:permease [Bacillus sp. CH30_1T]|uniref:permease n=1 Tax=Bacillus sp. CH30_1T TaxID=2604836 RepID=UPI0011F011E9|nr:permease [Bacillus sp. CH30_1T]KAA0563251.1 permease [Bacillus sp. CH30_1T]
MNSLRSFNQEMTGILLFMLFIVLFLAGDWVKDYIPDEFLTSSMVNVITIFLSILLEAIPFILIGVFASALIQVFVSESLLQKIIPKRFPYLALFPAAVVGALLPVCECAIVPVARRLIKKGMPAHLAIVVMVTAPILNPIVFASTYYAFQNNMTVVFGRMGIALIAALIIGALLYKFYGKRNPLIQKEHNHEHHHDHTSNKLMQTIVHASDEFFDMGKYLIIGAFVAAGFQTYLDRELLVGIGTNEVLAPAVMMGFAYIISLCSEADAFVASSFGSIFSASSILAFLVYGPMIDFKNTLLMLAYFNKKFVLTFIGVVTIVVYTCTLVFQFFV